MTDSTVTIAEQHGLFSAFRYRQYRFLWASTLVTYASEWMAAIVITWLVLELTNSAFMVGLAGTLRTVGFLLGPFCGIAVDRFNRRLILLAVQVVLAISSIILMILFFTSSLEVWHLFTYAVIMGIGHTFDFATRYAWVGDIVEGHHLTSATAFLFLTSGITSGIGPLLGGSLLGIIQASGCFALISASFLLSFLILLLMKTTVSKRQSHQESAWDNLVKGFRYIRNDSTILVLILFAAILNFFFPPIQSTLVPIFARDILRVGASGLGQLMGASGVGGLIGALIAGTLEDFRHKGRLLVVAIVGWTAVFVIFAASRIFLLSLAMLFMVGLTQYFVWSLIQILLLKWSSEEMRGRVMGARAFVIGTMPLGNLLTGAGASLWGAPIMLVIGAVACILMVVLISFRVPELYKRE